MPDFPESAARPAASTGATGHGSAQQPSSTYTPESDVHILDRIAVLFRYRRIALTVFVLTVAVMMIQGYSNIQQFQARAELQIEDERSTAVPGINNAENTYYEDPEPYYNTQYRILRGRDLTRRVIKRLKLDTVPEFNGTATPPPTPISMIRDLEGRMKGLIWSAPAATIEAPKVDESATESEMVSAFISHVGVESLSGDTVRFRLSTRGGLDSLQRALSLNGRLQPAAAGENGIQRFKLHR